MASSPMLVSAGHIGRSTDVKMELLLDEVSLPVGQLGPDFLLLKEAVPHPPADGILVLRVAESERRWAIRLPEGMSAGSRRVVISRAE